MYSIYNCAASVESTAPPDRGPLAGTNRLSALLSVPAPKVGSIRKASLMLLIECVIIMTSVHCSWLKVESDPDFGRSHKMSVNTSVIVTG